MNEILGTTGEAQAQAGGTDAQRAATKQQLEGDIALRQQQATDQAKAELE
ncbi:unnamed protein product [marine sediment metagenome]|uniref:Uncharacterized protein n=1 Tax=marine sediment metagenome TaxID=412755 RepID=X0SXR0_9ZZZZ